MKNVTFNGQIWSGIMGSTGNNERVSTAIPSIPWIFIMVQRSIVCVITSMDRCGALFSNGGWRDEVVDCVA